MAEARDRLLRSSELLRKFRPNIRHRVREAKRLFQDLEEVFDWMGTLTYDGIGLTTERWRPTHHLARSHLIVPGDDFELAGVDSNGLKRYRSTRGTSIAESFHHCLRSYLPSGLGVISLHYYVLKIAAEWNTAKTPELYCH